jgi:hypothetical protein
MPTLPRYLSTFGRRMGEETRAQTGGINKIEGGEGVECCVFLSLKEHINFVGDAPSPSHSHKPRPRNTGATRLQTNIGRSLFFVIRAPVHFPFSPILRRNSTGGYDYILICSIIY